MWPSSASSSRGSSSSRCRSGGDGDRVRAEPVVEVVAKTARPAQRRERLVRRRDDPPAEARLLPAADGRKDALLEDAQQLDLHRRGNLADLVEEDRAMRTAPREDAFVRLDRAGEGAFAVTEQLRLDERLGKLR